MISPPFLTVSVNSASGIMPKNIFSASSGLTLLQNRLKKYSLSVHKNSISPSSWLILTTLYPLSSICVVSFGDEISFLESLGISSKQSDDTVLAEYKDFKVTQGMVNFQKETGYNGSVDDALMTDEFDKYYNDHRAQLLKEHQSDVKYYS